MFINNILYDPLQVDLLISFCSEMGLHSVVLVGHDDGGLLALKAAEKLRTCGGDRKVLPFEKLACFYIVLFWMEVNTSCKVVLNVICLLLQVEVKGVVLIGVSLSREVIPAFARILLHTPLRKKHMVRPLLRTEITQVINRRAWYDATKLTTEILNLYKVSTPSDSYISL